MENIGKFEPLGTNELAELDQKRAQLHAYVGVLLPNIEDHAIDADLLDDLWVSWRNSNVDDREAALSFVHAFGTGFGDILANQFEFEWAILTDKYGTDYAVRALPGTANTRVAPLDFVMKRFQNSEDGKFVSHAISEIGALLEQHKAEWSESGAA